MTASYDSAPDDVEPTHNHAAGLADDLHDRSSALQGQVEAGGAARRYGLRLKTYQITAPAPGANASGRGGAQRRRLEYARHGRSIGGESPLEEEVVLTSACHAGEPTRA